MIGVFDSGLGGLSVLRHMRAALPEADLHYFADRAHAPYGEKTLEEVRHRAAAVTEFLLEQGAAMIVLACNTASAAALHHLRRVYPDLPFVGTEPAVKPAAALTRTGVIGVLATSATFQGELFASLVDRFGNEVKVLEQPCPGWAQLVEEGRLDGTEAEMMLASATDPVMAAGADTLVLGCTHYPFLADTLRRVVGAGVVLVDPGEAVARQAGRVAVEIGADSGVRELRFSVTGPTEGIPTLVERLVGWTVEVEESKA